MFKASLKLRPDQTVGKKWFIKDFASVIIVIISFCLGTRVGLDKMREGGTSHKKFILHSNLHKIDASFLNCLF